MGANVLDASKGLVNKGAILSANDENYLTITECDSQNKESLIINLSDDVKIDTILVSNREDFSSPLGDISFFGSIDYPPLDDKWTYLGTLQPELSLQAGHDGLHMLTFEDESSDQMVRFLKVEM